jgi:hypothetical protein
MKQRMRTSWPQFLGWLCLSSYLAFGFLLVGVARAQDEEARLGEIIANVRANEQLYRNSDVTYETSHRLENRLPHTSRRAISSSRVIERSVIQAGKTYCKRVNAGHSVEASEFEEKSLCAFDGKMTRFVSGNIANLHEGQGLNTPDSFRPHTWLLSRAAIAFPLSAWLRAGRELQEHPRAGMYKSWLHKVSLEKEEVVNGTFCLKIRSELWDPGDPPTLNTIRLLWLAAERNFLPIKTVGYAAAYSKELPLEEAEAGEFREVKAGVWLPFHYSMKVYDEIEVRERKRLVISNSEEGTIRSPNLEPAMDMSFFRDVPFPSEAVVYEFDQDGKLIRSYGVSAGAIGTSGSLSVLWPGRSLLLFGGGYGNGGGR